MPRFPKSLLAISAVLLSMFTSFFINNQQSSAISLGGSYYSQGATITKDYFLYTKWSGNNNYTSVHKCKREGTKIDTSSCESIINKVLGHANVLDHTWGSNYFWVFDEGNPRNDSSVKKWCFNLKGDLVSNSKCGVIPNNSASYVDNDGLTRQGYTQYGDYFLKGASPKNGAGTNSIYIVDKNNNIKKIKVGGSGELEDVMVDGDTGYVYYTTSSSGEVHLYKTDTKLEKISTIPDVNDTSTSKNKNTSESKDTSSTSAKNDNTINNGLVIDPTKNQKSKDQTVDTVLFGKLKDDGKGCGIYMTLNLVVDILTAVIGISAVIGIGVAGITYQSAKGNEAQTTKAKRRIYEIVIGLAAYAVLYAALNWLLPGGKINTSTKCKTACTTQIVEEKLAVSK